MSEKLEPLLHALVHNHPKMTPYDIAARLYPDGKDSSNYRKLGRQLNPDDGGSFFPACRLPQLIRILDEGLSREERTVKGGEAIIHFLWKESGMLAWRPRTAEKSFRGGGNYAWLLRTLGETIAVLGATLSSATTCSLTSASTTLVDHIYQAVMTMATMAADGDGEAAQ